MKLHVQSAASDSSKERTYPLLTQEDFNTLIGDFPQLRESLLRYSDVRLIAKDMASYLNSHHVHAWVTED